MPGFVKVELEDNFELVMLGEIEPLDLIGVQSLEANPTPSQKAVLQMFGRWDMIKANFKLIWSTLMMHEERAKGMQSSIKAQLQEAIDRLNDIRVKARLLSAKIGRTPKADDEGDTMLWEALSKLAHEFKIVKQGIKALPSTFKDTREKSVKCAAGLLRMDSNMTKMYTHYKGHLGTSNERLVDVEQSYASVCAGSTSSKR
jgi:hypothetical protein